MSTDREREALARSVHEKARSALGRATGPDLRGDNLGIALLTYISPSHPDDDCGWHPSAVDAVNAIFDDAIANLLAAGWMPRPEPEWEAMVERAARELIPDGETPSEGILERAEVMLRAALNTGDPDAE